MRMLANIIRGLRSLLRGDAVETEIDEELSSFVEASTEDKLRCGMPIEQARRAARVEMGSTNAVKHRIRSVGWETQAEIFWHDTKHSIRALWRSPGFTLIAVFSLALGIGGNTAIFTLVNQILLRNLPVRDPQELVTFGESTSSGILGGIDLGTADMFTYDFARQLETHPGPFQGVAAYSSFSPKVSVRTPNSAQAIQSSASLVSGNFFSVLGATPLLGRTIAPFDASAPDRSAVALVSYRFWQQELSADPAVLGRTIVINATPFTVIGVMPEAFHGIQKELDPPDLWVPVTMVQEVFLQPGMLRPRDFYILHMFARRVRQTSLAMDQGWLDRQIRDYVRAGGGEPLSPARRQEIQRLTVQLLPAAHGVSGLRSQYGDTLVILMAVVGVVLLIACANLANFLLARAVARQREIATRLALGSSRARIVRQSVAEALVLSLCGGLLGLVVAFTVTRALIAFVARDALFIPLDPRPDGAVLLFTFGVSILAGLLFGLAPAMHIARATASARVITNSRTAQGSGGRSRRWWQKLLVATQIMLCLSLLVVAGLFLRTLHNLHDQNFGFERSHMLIADFDARIAGYKPEQVPALHQRLLDRLAAIPGVRSAALAATPPVSAGAWTSSLSISGYTPGPKEDMGAVLNRVSSDYFDAAGIPILVGRPIQPSDTASALKVAVVNQSFARHYFPGGNIIGHTLKIDIGEPGPWQIAGIAGDTRSGNPREDAPRTVYLPLAQIAGARGKGAQDSYAWVMILRTSGDPAQTIASLKAAVAGVDPNLPVLQVRTIQDQLEGFMSDETLISRLTAVFAGLAVLLAAIGLYGVMSFNVARRTGEIGVRIALGASSSGVQWMVLRESLGLLGAGLGMGLPIALFAVRLVRSQLYEISPFDPATFIAAAVGIAFITIISAWVPARRAAAVDPMTALRCE